MLYPAITPFASEHVPVSSRHTLYLEQVGHPDGEPVLFLHGGPGGGISPQMRRFFDPERYRVVLFDQRGCGRSTPHADLVDNTTWHLISDIEHLRRHLGIERWLVFGGSWGSALGLAYAQAHPDRVSGLVLRGIFMLRSEEIAWFYSPHGTARLFPDAWEDFVAPIPAEERGDLVAAYYRRLIGNDEDERLRAARAWSVWEGSTSFLHPDPGHIAATGSDRFALAFARIEAHYFINGGFLGDDGALLANIDRIRHLPAVIVHGRYDVICPFKNAWDLHRAWPEATLRVVPDAGHSAMEPGTIRELVAATNRFLKTP